jgi:hypothetical protein
MGGVPRRGMRTVECKNIAHDTALRSRDCPGTPRVRNPDHGEFGSEFGSVVYVPPCSRDHLTHTAIGWLRPCNQRLPSDCQTIGNPDTLLFSLLSP